MDRMAPDEEKDSGQGRRGVIAFFDEIESTLPVSRWTMDGLHVWPILRNILSFRIVQEKFDPNNQISRYSTRFNRLKQIAVSLIKSPFVRWKDRAKNAKLVPGVDVLFLVNSTTRFFRVGGEWYNPYSDTFIKYLRDKRMTSVVLETTTEGEYRIPRFDESVLIQHQLFPLTALARVSSRITRAKDEQLESFEIFLEKLSTWFAIDTTPILNYLRWRVRQTRYFMKYFERILTKVKPSVTLLSGYYSTDAMAFIAACRALDIPTIEVQHGVQGDHHFAYSKWSALPESGYEFLPRIFWCWNEQSTNVISRWTANHLKWHRAIHGGNPCLEIFTKDGTPLMKSLAPEKLLEGHRAEGRLNILYTLQAFYALPEIVLDAMKSSPPEWTWWMRVHPQYWETREPIRKALNSRGLKNFFLDEASDHPMAVLLHQMDVHVTEFSSSALEAQATGVPTVLVNERAKSLFAPLIESGMARFAGSKADVIRSIQELSANKAHLATNSSREAQVFSGAIGVISEIVEAKRKALGIRSPAP